MTAQGHDYNLLERYAFCDPAGASRGRTGSAKLKRIRNRQAIVCIAADDIPRIFVLYAWAGRVATAALRDRIISVYEQFRPTAFGIEANAMQFLFADLVREEAKRQFGQKVRLIPINQPTNIDKDFRIRTTLQPVINEGRLFLTDRSLDLESELRGFPTAQFKDIVDALASAISLIPKRSRAQKRTEEADQLAAYLRRMGVHPRIIEERVAALQAEELAAQHNTA